MDHAGPFQQLTLLKLIMQLQQARKEKTWLDLLNNNLLIVQVTLIIMDALEDYLLMHLLISIIMESNFLMTTNTLLKMENAYMNKRKPKHGMLDLSISQKKMNGV